MSLLNIIFVFCQRLQSYAFASAPLPGKIPVGAATLKHLSPQMPPLIGRNRALTKLSYDQMGYKCVT